MEANISTADVGFAVTDNGTNTSCLSNNTAVKPDFPPGEFSAWMFLCGALHVVGAATAVILVFAVYHDHRTGKSVKILIGNIVGIDLILAAILMPLLTQRAYVVLTDPNSIRTRICQTYLTSSTNFVFIAMASWAEFALTLNRFFAICFPHYYKHVNSVCVTSVLVAVSWLFGLLNGVLIGNEIGVKLIGGTDGTCLTLPVNSFGNCLLLMMHIVPYSVMLAMMICVFVKAYADLRSSTNQQRTMLRRRLDIAKAMAGSLVWAWACTLPINILSFGFPHVFALVPSLRGWMRILLISEYALNPIFFFGLSRTYRRILRNKLSLRRFSGQKKIWPSSHDRTRDS